MGCAGSLPTYLTPEGVRRQLYVECRWVEDEPQSFWRALYKEEGEKSIDVDVHLDVIGPNIHVQRVVNSKTGVEIPGDRWVLPAKGFYIKPMTPQAMRAPAFPVFSDSASPPNPKSSVNS